MLSRWFTLAAVLSLVLVAVAAIPPAWSGGAPSGASADGRQAPDAPETLRIATVQLSAPQAGDFDAMLAYAKQAKAAGAVLVIYPESAVFGWLNPAVFTKAQPIPGAASKGFAAIAREAGVWVAAGLAERGPKGGIRPDVYGAYDSGILVNPEGEIVLHHRKYQVLKNAFDPDACQTYFGTDGCSYTVGPLSDIRVAETPFGRTAILVCADAYTYDTTALQALKALKPDFVIIPWGVAAGSQSDCGKENFNATGYAAQAAGFLGTAYVAGANAVGARPYGRFRPSWYCGYSGFAKPDGTPGPTMTTENGFSVFDIPVPGR